jgi:uncharacterized membrane protein
VFILPIVEIRRSFGKATENELWATLREFERYPEFAEHVVSVEILKEGADYKESTWVVLFNGNQLRWSERDYIDDTNRTIRFEQIDGDLAVWRGTLSMTVRPECTATYVVEFDLGVPALADLLNPLGIQAVRVNCEQILDAVARQLAVVAS